MELSRLLAVFRCPFLLPAVHHKRGHKFSGFAEGPVGNPSRRGHGGHGHGGGQVLQGLP